MVAAAVAAVVVVAAVIVGGTWQHSKAGTSGALGVGYTAQQIRTAYLAPVIALNGAAASVTVIAIYHYSRVQSDLTTFWQSANGMGLTTAAPLLRIHTMPGATENSSWAVIEDLDAQMVATICPMCTINIVEANSSSLNDYMAAINYATNVFTSDVVLLGLSASEFAGQTSLDSYFANTNIVYVAASGDSSSVEWPATSPNVVAVGGTALNTIGDGTTTSRTESAWAYGGSGYSTFYAKPSYQANTAAISGNFRAVPDISLVASDSTRVYCFGPGGWIAELGTEVSAPIMAGTMGWADPARNNAGKSRLTSVANTKPGSINVQDWLYQTLYKDNMGTLYTSGVMNDIRTGLHSPFTVESGYDLATGLGSPNIAAFVSALAVL